MDFKSEVSPVKLIESRSSRGAQSVSRWITRLSDVVPRSSRGNIAEGTLGFCWLFRRVTWLFYPLLCFPCLSVQAQSGESRAGLGIAPMFKEKLIHTPAEMMSRLMAIAEGAIPTEREIEHQFDVELYLKSTYMNEREYWGSAPLPFRQNVARNISYFQSSEERSVLLNFQHDVFCVSTQELQKKLAGTWRLRISDDGHLSKRVIYEATIKSVVRTLEFTPPSLQENNCLRLFSVEYRPIKIADPKDER